jgi:hypothetical protein
VTPVGYVLSDLQERLTAAFAEMYAANVPSFGGGGSGYYGVRVKNVAADGAEVELVVTFGAGQRYCCFEPGCHFAYYDARGWAKLRAAMDRQGLGHLPLPVIRRLRGVIEAGAVMMPTPNPSLPSYVSDTAEEYEVGPLQPIDGAGGTSVESAVGEGRSE